MKFLRQTIRNLILENIQEKNTIIDTILSSDPKGINSFLEFADLRQIQRVADDPKAASMYWRFPA